MTRMRDEGVKEHEGTEKTQLKRGEESGANTLCDTNGERNGPPHSKARGVPGVGGVGHFHASEKEGEVECVEKHNRERETR